jgi:hypothetical protein
MTAKRTTLAELQELATDEVAKLPVGHLYALVEDVAVLRSTFTAWIATARW